MGFNPGLSPYIPSGYRRLLRLRYGGNPLSAGGNESIEFVGLVGLEFPGDLCGFWLQLARLRLKLLDFGTVTGLHRFVGSHILVSEIGIGFYKSI